MKEIDYADELRRVLRRHGGAPEALVQELLSLRRRDMMSIRRTLATVAELIESYEAISSRLDRIELMEWESEWL